MKKKFRLLILLTAGLLLMIGADSCKKDKEYKSTLWWIEDGTELSEGDEEDDAMLNKEDAEQIYNEAFDIIKENGDYDLAVKKLECAAENRVDSANLTLAYMYEYGVGVAQDIERAKEYYAKELIVGDNEFASDKLSSLNDKSNNYKIVLPEGCKANFSSLAVMYEDVVTIANGNGTFNSLSNIVTVKNYDNKFVTLCYRHPSVTGEIELNSTESAITLLLGTIPFAFQFDEDLYNQARTLLLQFDETRQMADEIDRQLKKQGYFELSALVPYMKEVYNYMYSTYGGGNGVKSLSKTAKADNYTVSDYTIDDGKGNSITIAEQNRKKNDIETYFKNGSYDVKKKIWSVTLTTKNYSSNAIKVVPGTIDRNTNIFIPKYKGDIRVMKACTAMDLGGGSLSGAINTMLNFFPILWTACQRYASVDSDPYAFHSPLHDFYEAYAIMGDVLKEYKYEYSGVEDEIFVEICSNYDAVKYVFPNEDISLYAYYILYYAAVPILNAQYLGVDKPDRSTIEKVVDKALDKTMLDEDWVNGLNKFVYRKQYNVSDDDAREFYIKTFSAIYDVTSEGIGGEFNDFNKITKPTKLLSSSNKIGTKLCEGKDVPWKDYTKLAETYAIDGEDDLKDILDVVEGAENLITFFNGIIDMVGSGMDGEYLSFCVRFNMEKAPLTIKCTPVTMVATGYSEKVYASSNRNCNIIMYINDKEVTSISEASSLSYDLSQLSLGTYRIKFKAYDGPDIVETQEFICVVSTGKDSGSATVPDLEGENL